MSRKGTKWRPADVRAQQDEDILNAALARVESRRETAARLGLPVVVVYGVITNARRRGDPRVEMLVIRTRARRARDKRLARIAASRQAQ